MLGEYLSDMQAVWDFTQRSNGLQRPLGELNDPINRGLAPYLRALYGDEIALGYIGDLLNRAREQHREQYRAKREAEAQARWQQRLAKARAATKVEPQEIERPKPKAPKRRGRKPRRQSLDTRVHDKKLREAMVKVVNRNGRVNRGLRRLAKDAEGISEASVRRALDAWQADGQLTREGRGKGKTQSIKLHLDHPAWSGYLPSHPPTI